MSKGDTQHVTYQGPSYIGRHGTKCSHLAPRIWYGQRSHANDGLPFVSSFTAEIFDLVYLRFLMYALEAKSVVSIVRGLCFCLDADFQIPDWLYMWCVFCDVMCVGYLGRNVFNVCFYLCSLLVFKLVHVRNNGFKSVLYIQEFILKVFLLV